MYHHSATDDVLLALLPQPHASQDLQEDLDMDTIQVWMTRLPLYKDPIMHSHPAQHWPDPGHTGVIQDPGLASPPHGTSHQQWSSTPHSLNSPFPCVFLAALNRVLLWGVT
jgi:hypothetical protein